MNKLIRILLIVIFLTNLSFSQKVNNQDQIIYKKLVNLSLEELLKYEITSATKIPQKIKDIPASVTLITREDIQTYGYTSLVEIIDNTIGLYALKNRDFMGTAFGIRGYYAGLPKNINFLINGVDQSSVYGIYYQPLMDIPVESIDRIEVVKGPMSIIYGSGAFFGSVNIVTDEINQPKNSHISVSYGSDNRKKVSGKFTTRIEELGVAASLGYIKSDGPDEPFSRMVSDISKLEQFGISVNNNNLTTENRLEKEHIYLNMTGSYKGVKLNIGYQESNREELHFWPSPYDGLLDRRRFTNISLSYDKKLSQKFSLHSELSRYNFSYWRDFDYFIPNFFGQELCESNETEFELSFIYSPSKRINFRGGINYKVLDEKFKLDLRKVVLLNTGYNLSNVKTSSQFLQVNYTPFEKLILTGGLRFETLSEFPINFFNNESDLEINSSFDAGTEIVTRVGIIYNINAKNVLKILYGTGAMFPSTMDIISNKMSYYPDLKAEKIETFEINYTSIIHPEIMLDISVFRNNLDNLMTMLHQFDEEGDDWAPRRTNEGEMLSKGIEVKVKADLLKPFSLELGATYQETENRTMERENITPGYSPKLLGYVKSSYLFTPDISLAITGKYVDEMETLWDVTKINAENNLGARIAKKTDHYFLLDLALRFNKLFNDDYYLRVRCTNILNTQYLYPLHTSNSGWADKGTFGDSRKIYLTLGYNF